MIKPEDLTTPCPPTWCRGCGNYGTWGAFKAAALQKGWDNSNTCLVAGIGCHSHILNFTKITSLEGLHGRAIPVATGIKLANRHLNVFVFSGDGDCLGEGGNHLLHVCRRNHDIVVIIHNNGLYSLTTGQTSPTSPADYKSKSTPAGNHDNPLNPVALSIASGATFVARALSTDIPKLTELMIKAAEYKGAAIIEVLQPCPTLNKEYTHQFFQENCYWLDQSYNPKDKVVAFAKSLEWGEKKIPLGIFYLEEKPSYESTATEISLERNLEDLFKKFT